jgi:hypothetical protein
MWIKNAKKHADPTDPQVDPTDPDRDADLTDPDLDAYLDPHYCQ